MSLIKYFEKRAKDDLPDPNDPLSSRIPLDESVGQPRGIWARASGISAELAASDHEEKNRGPYDRYLNSYSYSAFYACNSCDIEQDCFLKYF